MINKNRPESASGASKDTVYPQELLAMSNQQLLDEVDAVMSLECSNENDIQRLEQCLALLQERAPVMETYDAGEEWKELVQEQPLLFQADLKEEQKHGIRKGKKTSLTGRSVSRVLRGLGIVAAVLLCLIITASAMGYNPVQAFFIWADGVVQIYSNPSGKMELPESSTSDYISLSQALIENGLDDAGCPTWIPKDYEILSVDTAFAGNIDKYSAVYYSQRGEILIRVMKFCDGNWNIIDERDDGGRMETINGLECHIISNMEQCKAGWVIGSCSYLISGQITEDELITMIESIKQGEK